MTLEPTSADIIQLAWARHLGLADDAFSAAAAGIAKIGANPKDPSLRITRADDSLLSVTFIRLFGTSALVGPQWALDAAVEIPDEELAQHVTLLTLTRGHGGHGLGSAALFFADELPLLQPSEELSVSRDEAAALELEALCPPDDVHEAGLAGMERRYTIVHSQDKGPALPVACGGYTEWEGILAHLGVLVAPEWRRLGLGGLAASIAAHEALASGLTLQWRTDVSNKGALAMARSLGFVTGGIESRVLLAPES
jgi:GNAT superfamily N-acetyltransferase